MRTPVIAGNWKMFKTVAQATVLVREMRRELNNITGVVQVLCPPFTALSAVADLVQKTNIKVGAQDLYWEEQGAFTGEVSPAMLKELCQYVIIGHSERRQYFGETDESVNRKVKVALKHGLIPIICVGENLAQNEAGQTEAFVSSQVRAALRDLTAEEVRGLVIAYEPIWAIGTGKAATGAGANRIIGLVVRGTVASLCGETVAQAVRIQYGGSVSPDNIAEFMNQPEIDGALVGGASLVGSKFLAITRQAAASKGLPKQMGGDWTPLLWLIVLFAPLLSVKRWLSRHLQGVGLLLFGNHEGATALHYVVLLPGVILHELCHWLAAKLVGVRTAGISLMPQVKRGGTVRLGAVKVAKSDPLRESWIGIAPFIGGTVAILLLASWQFGVELQPVLSLELVLHTLASSLQTPDALLWLYLLFSISNAMLPSESDRQPWLSALIFLGVVAAIIYISGVSVRIPVQVKEWVLTGATYLAFTFGLVLAVDIPVVFLLMIIEKLGAILLGRHVQY